MSYDLRIAVKVDGGDKFAQIAEPECGMVGGAGNE